MTVKIIVFLVFLTILEKSIQTCINDTSCMTSCKNFYINNKSSRSCDYHVNIKPINSDNSLYNCIKIKPEWVIGKCKKIIQIINYENKEDFFCSCEYMSLVIRFFDLK